MRMLLHFVCSYVYAGDDKLKALVKDVKKAWTPLMAATTDGTLLIITANSCSMLEIRNECADHHAVLLQSLPLSCTKLTKFLW